MSNPTHVVVAGTRRSWTREQKQTILTDAKNPATTVSAVARRHGIAPSLLFRWRREAVDAERAAALPPQPAFIPLCLPGPVSTATCERTQSGIIEIELATGQAASFDPAEEIADQVQASPCAVASELVPDEMRRVEFDELSVGSALQAPK